MARRVKIGLVQPNVWDDMAANIGHVSALVRKAKADGAEFIATPENSGFMGANAAASVAAGQPEERHPALQAYRDVAKELSCWLLVGSLGIKPEGANRNFNRSYLVAPDGGIAARYDKIHLFDVDLPSGETYRESNSIAPGSEGVVTDMPFARLGMSICYDLRFPGLYRGLAQAGAEIISIPAAFTRTTGQAHWHVLLRAQGAQRLPATLDRRAGPEHAQSAEDPVQAPGAGRDVAGRDRRFHGRQFLVQDGQFQRQQRPAVTRSQHAGNQGRVREAGGVVHLRRRVPCAWRSVPGCMPRAARGTAPFAVHADTRPP